MNDTVESLAPWFYEYDFGPLGKTKSRLPPEVQPVHPTRLAMLHTVLDRLYTPGQIRELTAIDIACHEGYYTVALAQKGFKRVLAIDVRESSLRKAQFAANAFSLHNAEFRMLNAEDLSPESAGGVFDVTLFYGLLYHLENPMLCLRRAYSVTEKLFILETQIIDEHPGQTEWGMRTSIYPYKGILALIDESEPFHANNPEMGATPLATCPSKTGLVTMLRHAGFRDVTFVDPPADAYEQHARGKRVVCYAFK